MINWQRFALIIGLLVGPSTQAQPVQPNIVFVLADDLGWNDIGYNNPEVVTPQLDGLAAQGVKLTQYRVNPVCSPTRASLLTGQTALRTSVVRPGLPLPLELGVMPEPLQAAGYQTWLVGKWHLGETTEAHLPNQRGFDHFYGFHGGTVNSFTHMRGRGMNATLDWRRNGELIDEEGYTTHLLADEAISLIENRDTARPFFLDLSFNAPHTPLLAPQEFIDHFARIDDEDRRVYLAMVEAMDVGIGRLYDVLVEQGIADDTLFVFMSDNGGNARVGGANNEPLRDQKGSPFEGGERVPAFVLWPDGLDGAREFSDFITLMDWVPTISAITGIAPPNEIVDGFDMLPALRDGQVVARGPSIVGSTTSWAVFDGDWKLVERNLGTRVLRFLFRIFEDPNEENNLLEQNPDVAARLTAILDAHPDGAAGMPVISSVVNSPDFTAPIGPQSWVTIFGENFSRLRRIWTDQDFQGPNFPRQLDDIEVTINGEPAYPYYISPTQLNVLSAVTSATGPVNVQVTTTSGPSDIFSVEHQTLAPALFMFNPADRKYIAAVHPDGVRVARAGLFPGGGGGGGGRRMTRPAKPGDVITFFGSGFGPTDPPTPDGEIISSPLGLANDVTILFGGVPAEVTFAGVVQAGVYQFNVIVPDDVPDGDVAVVAEIGGVPSQADACITIAR